MKISAKAKDCSLLVRVKTTAREKIDEKELNRFARAYLRCFLKPKQIKADAAEYSGPIGIPLKDRLKKEITKRDFLFIIEYLVVAVQKLHGNNFPINNLNMDMQYIYINETTKELQFLFVPLIGRQESGNLIELLNSVIYLARPAAENDTEYISRFNYFVKSIHPFDINLVEKFVQHEDGSVVNTVRKHNAGQSGFMTSDHKRYYEHVDVQKKEQKVEEMRQVERAEQPTEVDEDATSLLMEAGAIAGCFAGYGETASPGTGFVQTFDPGASLGETTGCFTSAEDTTGLLTDAPGVLGCFEKENVDGYFDEDATSLLVEEDDTGRMFPKKGQVVSTVVYPELYRKQTGETIQVNKPVFRIGKERSYVDYFVSNNNAVSRSHADIITRQTGYCVIDLNSKNRTYINNQAIVPQTETMIKDGDLLRLGNEEFIFRIAGARPTVEPLCCPNCNTRIAPGSNFCGECGQRI